MTVPDFDARSRMGATCSVSGRTRHPDYDFIFRLAYIDEEGFFDVDPEIIRDMAENVLGMASKKSTDKLKSTIKDLRTKVRAADKMIKALEQQCEALQDVAKARGAK